MGITSSLFYNSSDPEKQTLHKRIILTEEQFDEQRERWNALADHLRADLKERTGINIRTWLQGSYKFGTQIRPVRMQEEFDIDLGLFYPWEGGPIDGPFEPNELKVITNDSLREYENGDVIEVVIPPKIRCSRIRFKGNFHIDVPSYHINEKEDERTLATEHGWEVSDPKQFYVWFKDFFSDEEREKVRRYIRYIKCWAALKFIGVDNRPSSTLITVLVADAAKKSPIKKMSDDDDALVLILEKVVDRLEEIPDVPNPVNENEILTERLSPETLQDIIKRLKEFRDCAKDALGCKTLIEAVDKWSKIFDHFFPLPDSDEIMKMSEAGNLLPVPAAIPDVSVRALSRDNPNLKWEGKNRIGPIPKNCTIYFHITNVSDFSFGVEFEWMVRNEGNEAENINDLGHRAGRGIKAEEHSAYRGTHFMDCVVKRNGHIISLRRIPVHIADMLAPKRNPPRKRPFYRLPGKR